MDRSRNEPGLPRDPRPPDAPDSSRPRRSHDQTYKEVFKHPVAVQSLIRDFLAPEWHDLLDLDSAMSGPTETITEELERRFADLALRVRFKDSRASVVFLVEFQSSRDPEMAIRTLEYAVGAIKLLRANPQALDGGGAVPLVLSCIVYTGPRPWPAETSLAVLMRTPELPRAAARAVAGFGTAHRCLVLDLQSATARDLLSADSVLGWLGALEREPWSACPGVQASLAERCPGADQALFRKAFAKWTRERMRAAGVPAEEREIVCQEIKHPKEEAEMGQTYQEWAEGYERAGMEKGMEKGLAEGMAQGMTRGRRAMVLQLAARKFGVGTAKRLEGLVGAMDPEQLIRVGDAVVDCATGDELLTEAVNGASGARKR